MMETEERRGVGEVIDRLVSVPVYTGSSLTRRPVLLELYEAARAKFKDPLAFLAAEALKERVKPGDTVLLTTGFIVPPWLRAETDGPVGAAGLARALNLCLDITPVIVTERKITEMIPPVLRAAGFEVDSYSRAKAAYRRIAVEAFTNDLRKAKNDAVEILDRMKPSAIISIEKASPNEKGVYHSGVGYDLTPLCARVDAIIDEARSRGIVTIGIGDGGNEIGMGCIKDTVKKVVPTGGNCGCPCGAGTHSGVETDILVVCMVSNWGCTAIEANLALSFGRTEILHSTALEDKMLEEAASAGFIDPASGLGVSMGDAIDKEVHLAIVEILSFIVRSRLQDSFYIYKYKEYVREKRDQIHQLIRNWNE
jgi:D-glutamate cyclase